MCRQQTVEPSCHHVNKIYMENNKEIKIDPWGNPMVILTQEDA